MNLVSKPRLSYFGFGASQRYWLKTLEMSFPSPNIILCVLNMTFLRHLVWLPKPTVWTLPQTDRVIEEKNWGEKEIRREKNGSRKLGSRMKEERNVLFSFSSSDVKFCHSSEGLRIRGSHTRLEVWQWFSNCGPRNPSGSFQGLPHRWGGRERLHPLFPRPMDWTAKQNPKGRANYSFPGEI